MDSWGFASDESPSTGKGQIGPMNWEVKAPFIFTNNMGLLLNEENIDRQVFVEMGLRNSLFNPVMAATQNAFSEENESSSKLESNCRESELFDLKPCRIIEQREAQIFNSSKIYHNFCPSEASTPSKRPRVRGFGSSTPFCQVYGCNKNLSSCKDYHKRHKVCEVHSKTAKVIVNGIEQRFCQQCSRFHLLCEFDDGKRSCRKRLAGHNERRRKPHVGVVSGRHERLLPSYSISVEGNQLKGSTGAILSFPLSKPHRSPHQQKHKPNGWCQMNLEDQTPHDLRSISSITDEQLYSQSLDGIINRYIGASNSSSTRLSMVSSSGSALSLLSSQSQSTSCYSSRIHMSNSHSHLHSDFMFPGSNYELTQDSRVLHDMNPVLNSEGSLVIFGDDGMFHGSKHVNSYRVFSNEGRTIDLLQLSSQLERLEHQKRTNGVSVGLSIT